jgi:hypothetical protein
MATDLKALRDRLSAARESNDYDTGELIDAQAAYIDALETMLAPAPVAPVIAFAPTEVVSMTEAEYAEWQADYDAYAPIREAIDEHVRKIAEAYEVALARRPFPEAFTAPPIPPELCGVDGCSLTPHERGVFRDGTVINGHSWER